MGMIVRLQLTLKIAQFLLKLLSFLFECFNAMVNLRVFVAVLFDGHESSFKRADGILASGSLDFKSAVWEEALGPSSDSRSKPALPQCIFDPSEPCPPRRWTGQTSSIRLHWRKRPETGL